MKLNINFYECAILGAGLSGLAAAIRLSHFGKKIVLIEKNAYYGGLNTFYFKRGIEIDSGLHAMTNFCKKNDDKSLPLNKLLRQLRIAYDELELIEQIQSEIKFPFASITFNNDFLITKNKFKSLFPESAEGFEQLCTFIKNYDAFSLEEKSETSARAVIKKFIQNENFEDMMLLPLMYYGNAREYDMELSQFIIMFKSIFIEGLCRPKHGIKKLLNILAKKLNDNLCEIRRNKKVSKIYQLENGKFKIILSDNSEIIADKIISSFGALETMKLIEGEKYNEISEGKMGFAEAIFCLKNDAELQKNNFINTCTFFCENRKFNYKIPENAFDTNSGVICCPANFKYKEKNKNNSFIRLTALANPNVWLSMSEIDYEKTKKDFEKAALNKIAKIAGIVLTPSDILFSDIFTPKTILKWTGHINGAIYGCPNKFKDGKTKYQNLFLCGTDQGFLGITGSILSGISIANKYALT